MVIDELIVLENGEQKFVDSADNKIIDVIQYNSGKNLFDEIFDFGAINANTGIETKYSNPNISIYTPNYISIKPNTQYVMTNGIFNRFQKIRFYDANKNYIGYSFKKGFWLAQTEYASLINVGTTPDNAYFARFELDFDDVETSTAVLNGEYPYMLEEGDTATDYEPYGGADYHFARENEVTDGVCDNAVAEPIIDMQISGNSVYESVNLFDKNNVLSGFLPTSGAYPTISSSHPDATYQIIDMKAGQTFRITYTGTNAQNGRIRYIDNDTNEVVGMIEKTTSTGNGYYVTSESQNNGFKDAEITALKDFKLGVLYLYAMPSDFNLQIISIVPNPSMPLEIVSVGDKTNNLIDISSIANDYCTVVNGALEVRIISGNSSSGCGKTLKQLCPDIEAGKTYTLSFVTDSDYSSAISIGAFGTNANRWESGKQRTISEVDLETIVRFGEFGTGDRTITFSNIQITEEATDVYEPYGKYKVPIKVRGKNLFNNKESVRNAYCYTEPLNNGIKVISTSTSPTDAMNLYYHLGDYSEFVGKTVSFSAESVSNTDNKTIAGYLISNTGDYASNTIIKSSYFYLGDKTTITATIPANDTAKNLGIRLFLGTGIDQEFIIDNIQAEISETATEYEPYFEPTLINIYLNQPLRKVGDYADYIDYKNKKVVRNIYSKVCTGTEIVIYGSRAISITAINPTAVADAKYLLCKSNYYSSSDWQGLYAKGYTSTNIDTQGIAISGSNIRIVDMINFPNVDSDETQITAFKTWLAEQYANGTPLIIDYVLATPTEETIVIPEISTADGTNIFDIATTIEPSEFKLDYWKQIMPEEVNNV